MDFMPTYYSLGLTPRPPLLRWYRLPSVVWFVLAESCTVALAVLLILKVGPPWPAFLGLASLVAVVGSFIASIRDGARFTRPILPVITLALTVLVNPYTVLGLLVQVGVLNPS